MNKLLRWFRQEVMVYVETVVVVLASLSLVLVTSYNTLHLNRLDHKIATLTQELKVDTEQNAFHIAQGEYITCLTLKFSVPKTLASKVICHQPTLKDFEH